MELLSIIETKEEETITLTYGTHKKAWCCCATRGGLREKMLTHPTLDF